MIGATKRVPTVIGWSEILDLPDWGVKRLRAKIDTGARSSALHVTDVELLSDAHIAFDVVLHRKKKDRRIRVVAPLIRTGRVRSSAGTYTRRFFVKTTLRLGPVEKEIEISLVDREKMVFRMLLGRTALAHDFVIDPSRRRIVSAKPSKKGRGKISG